MTSSNGAPPILPGCSVLPPMDPAPERQTTARTQSGKASKAKGKPTGERFKTLNSFIDYALADLSRAEIAVWLILYRDTRDGAARTAYDDLARRAGLNRRNVGRAVRRLKDRGLLRIVYQGGFRRGASRYTVRGLPKEG